MLTFVRFFIKHSNSWMDFPMPEGGSLPQLMHAVRTDGFVVGLDFYIPYNMIKYVATYNAPHQMGGKIMPFVVPSRDDPA